MKNELKKLIQELYKTREQLKLLFNNWSFTLDGNLIGDIGEAIACYHFDLEPLKKGVKTHDAITKSEPIRYIQIKTTQKDTVGLGLEKRDFEYLIVIQIDESGSYKLVYNGPGENVWKNTKSNSISVKKLSKIQKQVELKDCIQPKIKIP